MKMFIQSAGCRNLFAFFVLNQTVQKPGCTVVVTGSRKNIAEARKGKSRLLSPPTPSSMKTLA